MGNGILKNKTLKIVLIALAALLLLLAVFAVFFRGTGDSKGATELERRLTGLLAEIDGVESASAMITEEDGVPVSAVVVFAGEDGILVRMRVLDATAAALGIGKSKIQVYPAAK